MAKNPWDNGGGERGRPQPSAPNVEYLFAKGSPPPFMKDIGKAKGVLIKLAVVVAAGLWLLSGFYIVEPDQQGVVLRFGKYHRTTGSGLHYRFPFPIEKSFTPRVTQENRISIGNTQGNESSRNYRPVQADETLMLTGDENIVDASFTITWRIKDAGDFLFNVRYPEFTVKAAAESAMREVIGQMPIANALAQDKRAIQDKAQQILQNLLDEYEAGISITMVQLQKVDPPAQVIDAFNDVQRARADQDRLKNEAIAYRNDILPKAKGEAARRILDAEAYKEKQISLATGETQRFLSVQKEYRAAREVTARRMYIETIEEVLGQTSKVIMDKSASGGVVPYLPLPALNNR